VANPERVVLDTSALYALISSADEFHQQAERTYRELLAGDTGSG
jgi:predicted nucleic acid-binding protein